MINRDPNHKHTYDEHGNMTCCSLEEKIYADAKADNLLKPKEESHEHAHDSEEGINWNPYIPASISFALLMLGIVVDNFFEASFFNEYIRLALYAMAYLPVGLPVMKDAVKAIRKGEIF